MPIILGFALDVSFVYFIISKAIKVLQYVYIFGTNSGFSDMQPGVCVFCQLRGQAGQPESAFSKAYSAKVDDYFYCCSSHSTRKTSILRALSKVILLKDICSAHNLTPLNSFLDLIISSPFNGPKWGQIHLTLFFLVSQAHQDVIECVIVKALWGNLLLVS